MSLLCIEHPNIFWEKVVKIRSVLKHFSRMYKPLNISVGTKSTTVTHQVPISFVFVKGIIQCTYNIIISYDFLEGEGQLKAYIKLLSVFLKVAFYLVFLYRNYLIWYAEFYSVFLLNNKDNWEILWVFLLFFKDLWKLLFLKLLLCNLALADIMYLWGKNVLS